MNESQTNPTERRASSELTGGAGFTYEDSVVGYFLTALLRAVPATSGHGTVIRVAVQQRAAGHPLDDIVVDTQDARGERQLSLQVKRRLTISAAARNRDFLEIVADGRITRSDPNFQIGRDAYGFVAQYVAQRRVRNLCRIVELANPTLAEAIVDRLVHSNGHPRGGATASRGPST